MWLKYGVEVPDNCSDTIFSDLEQIGKYQASAEAYNILYACLNSLDRENTYTAVLDILYNALTTDAISGYAAAKRDIFNWWIVEVVPSAYCWRFPATIYSGKWKFRPLSEYRSEKSILVS